MSKQKLKGEKEILAPEYTRHPQASETRRKVNPKTTSDKMFKKGKQQRPQEKSGY